MKILGLVASPRKGGNSELVVKEIMQHFPADWERSMIRLTDLDLKYCKACYGCLPQEKACVLQDDMNFLASEIRSADKIILAGATYFLGAHSSMKLIRDRLISVMANFEEFAGKDCVLAASYGLKHWDGMVKEDFIVFAREFNLHIVDSALLYATLPGEAVMGDNLKIVQRLADSLLTGKKYVEATDELLCPYCGGRGLRLHTDGRFKCLTCAGDGTLEFKDGQLKLNYDPEKKFNHFTDETKRWHAKILDEKKKLFFTMKDELKKVQARYTEPPCWVLPPSKSLEIKKEDR